MKKHNFDLKKGDTDALGNTVHRVFSAEPRKYIIYETTEGSIVADAADSNMSAFPAVTEWMIRVTNLLSQHPDLKPRVIGYVAYAYKILFDGDSHGSEATLKSAYANVVNELERAAKLAYLAGALSAMVCALLTLLIPWLGGWRGDLTIRIFCAAAFSAMGGFLSVAVGARNLVVEDKSWINFLYGGMRIVIAVISGVVMTFLVRSGIALAFLQKPDTLDGFFIATFLSGFSEKLVPNLLSGLGTKQRVTPSATRAAAK